MKMTIDIDEHALEHFMSVIGVSTKREAVNEAIRIADRVARRRLLLESSFSADELRNSVDPAYSLSRTRMLDVPD